MVIYNKKTVTNPTQRRDNRMKKRLTKMVSAGLVMAVLLQTVVFAEDKLVDTKKEAPKYDVTEIIVKYKENANAEEIKSRVKSASDVKLNLKRMESKTEEKTEKAAVREVLDVGSADKMEAALKAFEKTDGVEFAAPNYKIYPFEAAEDSGQTTGDDVNINLVSAWALSDGANVTVAVADTGIDINHPDLAGHILSGGRDFVNGDNTVFDQGDSAHGTQVAGLIARTAPGAAILPLKVIDSNGFGYTSDVMEAIEYAESQGADIMNLSFGTEEYNYALKYVMDKSSMLFVCAGGNDSDSGKAYPAAFSMTNMVSVGAVNRDGTIAGFTNTGAALDCYAPGVDLYTIAPNNGYDMVSGTSFAAALVTGAAALVKSAVPVARPSQTAIALKKGNTEAGPHQIRVLDAHKAITMALPLNFLSDEDGRLARAMKYAGLLITPAMAAIFTTYETYTELDNTEKETFNVFFNVTDTEMVTATGNDEFDLTDAVILVMSAKKVEISLEDAAFFHNLYGDTDVFDSEIESLSAFLSFPFITADDKTDIIFLMKDGHTATQVASAMVYGKTTNRRATVAIKPIGGSFFQPGNPEAIDFVERYHLNFDEVMNTLSLNGITVDVLEEYMFNWQVKNNFFIINRQIVPYSTGTPEIPIANKYKVQTGDFWSDGNALIDKTDGMLSYSLPLFSLPGHNGLDLGLGIRFDPEVNDAANRTKDAVDIPTSYYANGQPISKGQAEYYSNLGQTVRAYVTDVNAAEGITRMNLYNEAYGLGVGWALQLPLLELTDSVYQPEKHLHLPDGSKYKINEDYTLDGYLLQNVTFGPSIAFTADGITSAYALTDISGTSTYFDVNGRYLGTQDILGNKTEVHYNAQGRIERLVGTDGRSIGFFYDYNIETYETFISITLFDKDDETSKLLYTLKTEYKNMAMQYWLTEITDAAGQITKFDYQSYYSPVTVYGQSSTASVTNYAIQLSGITSSTGAYTEYFYGSPHNKKYGAAGLKKYFPIMQIKEFSSKTSTEAKCTVSYSAPNLAYQKAAASYVYPHGTVSWKATKTFDDAREVTAYNQNLQAVNTKYYDTTVNNPHDSNGKLVSESTVISFDSYNQPTNVQTKTYGNTTTSYTLNKAHSTWDVYGNMLTSETWSGDNVSCTTLESKAFLTFDYNISKTTPVSAVQYSYTDSDTTSGEYLGTKISSTVNPATGQVTHVENHTYNITTQTNEKLLNQTDFTYNNYGQLIHEQTFFATDNQTLVLESQNPNQNNQGVLEQSYEYDTKYGVYPASVKTHNVRDVYGSLVKDARGYSLPCIEETSEYNFLGQVIRSGSNATSGQVEYLYDPVTGEAIGQKLFDGQTLLGQSSSVHDRTNRTVTVTNLNGTGTKTEYNEFGATIAQWRLNKNGQFELTAKNLYDDNLMITDQIVYRNTTGTEYNKTHYVYDSQKRIKEVSTRDENNNLVEAVVTTDYAEGISKTINNVNGTYNTVTTTIHSGNPAQFFSQTTEYMDATGKLRSQDFTGDSGTLYTNNYIYEELSVLKEVNGDLQNTETYTADPVNNASTVDKGFNETSDNNDKIRYTDTTDGLGRTIYSMDANGSAVEEPYMTTYTYDILGRVIKTETPFDKVGNTIVYTTAMTVFDAAGNVIESRQQNNEIGEATGYATKQYKYDVLNRVTAELTLVDPHWQFIQYAYKGVDSEPCGVYTGLDYLMPSDGAKIGNYAGDLSQNRQLDVVDLVMLKKHLAGSDTLTGYGLALADADQNELVNASDLVKLKKVILGLDSPEFFLPEEVSVVRYTYDFYGNLTHYTDALLHTDLFKYDEFTGQLQKKTLRNGKKIEYTYSATGQLLTETGTEPKAANPSITNSFIYNLAGQLTSSSGNASSTTYSYDQLGRIKSEGLHLNDPSLPLRYDQYGTQYIYDGKELRHKTIHRYKTVGINPYEYVFKENYYYTASGQIERIEKDYVQNRRFVYDNNGNLERHILNTIDGDQIQHYEYNQANQLTKTITRNLYQISTNPPTITYRNDQTYTYRMDGKIAEHMAKEGENRNVTQYAYDGLGQLTRAYYAQYRTDLNYQNGIRSAFSDKSLEYDSKGNRVYESHATHNYSYERYFEYDKANRLRNEYTNSSPNTSPSLVATYSYDLSGNLTKGGSATYTYDAMNRTSSIKRGSITTNYKYDTNGKRIHKKTGNTLLTSIWSGDKIVYETDGTPANDLSYRWGASGLLAYEEGGETYVNALSWKGDVFNSRLPDSAAAVTNSVVYDSFGRPSNATATSFGYNSEYTDPETGFQYLGERYYMPELGRFTQEDPAQQGTNLYIYCNNDPVNNIDPSGLWYKNAQGGWVAERGDTLWGLADKLYDNGNRWTEFGFKRDPRTLQVGEVIKVGGTNGGSSNNNSSTNKNTGGGTTPMHVNPKTGNHTDIEVPIPPGHSVNDYVGEYIYTVPSERMVYISRAIVEQMGFVYYGNISDLNRVLNKYRISTVNRIAHFLSQCMYETDFGLGMIEYASGNAYEGRKDLGNIYIGDGPKFKGAGFIHLTGRYNYQLFANYIGDQKVMQGHTYVAKNYAWEVAGWFWFKNGLNTMADRGESVKAITTKVRGSSGSWEKRSDYYNRFLKIWYYG